MATVIILSSNSNDRDTVSVSTDIARDGLVTLVNRTTDRHSLSRGGSAMKLHDLCTGPEFDTLLQIGGKWRRERLLSP